MLNAEQLEDMKTRLLHGEATINIACHFGISTRAVRYHAYKMGISITAKNRHVERERKHV